MTAGSATGTGGSPGGAGGGASGSVESALGADGSERGPHTGAPGEGRKAGGGPPGLHLYCVTPAETRVPDGLTGAGGGAVETARVGEILLWFERGATPAPSEIDVLRRHHAVIEAAAEVGPCLPIRFGARFADEDALRSSFEEKEHEIRDGLARVVGCREFGVLVLEDGPEAASDPDPPDVPPDIPPDGRPGTSHLQALARREEGARERVRRAEAVSREVESEVAGLLRAVRWEPLPPDRGLVALAHLVPATAEDAYRTRIRRWSARRRDLRAVPTGPWPPYSFTP